MASHPKKRRTRSEEERKERPRERTFSADSLNAYIREIAKFKQLTPDEEKELGRRIQEGDQEALRRMVESNLRFVVHYAKR